MTTPSSRTALAVVPAYDLTTSDPGSALPASAPSDQIRDSLARIRATRRAILALTPAEPSDYHGNA